MKTITSLIINALVVILGAYLIPGIEVNGFITALIVAIILAIINAIIKPVLVLLTIPITFLTFGLFLLVINAAMIKLAGILIPGFIVGSFWSALLFSLLLSAVNWLFQGGNSKKH